MGGGRNDDSGVYSGSLPSGTEETIREDLEGGRRAFRRKEEVSTEMIVLKTGSEKPDRGGG